MPKKRKSKRRISIPSLSKGDLRELELHAMNTQSIYRQVDAFALNYIKRKMRGTYDRAKAIKGLANNLVPNILKSYNKAYGKTFHRVSNADKKKLGQKLLSWVNELGQDIKKHTPSRLPKALRTKKPKGRRR